MKNSFLSYEMHIFYVLLTMHPDIIVYKNQLDAQLVLSVFRQPLHVSGVSRPVIRRYNRMYTTICTFYWFQSNQHNRQSPKKNNTYNNWNLLVPIQPAQQSPKKNNTYNNWYLLVPIQPAQQTVT